ncbi:MAG: alpha/beta hydrolase [Bacteroidota bacterium]
MLTHKTTKREYGEVHYWISDKKKDTIVFTHGALMNHDLFRHQVDFFAKEYTVITWDAPAHGLSRPYQSFSLKQAADDVIALLDAEGIKSAHLVGQSMGGYIIQIVARNYASRVNSLTIIGSSPLQPQYYSAIDNWLLSITPFVLKMYPYQYLIKIIAQQVSSTPDGQSYALRTLQQYTKAEIVMVMKAVYVGVRQYYQNTTLSVPILITYGANDKTGRVKAYSDQWAKLENRDLKVIERAAHNANMDNPSSFNEILEDYLVQQ